MATGIGLVGTLVVLEIGYRWLRSSGLSPTTNAAFVEYDPVLGWRHRPLARERHVTDEFDVEVSIHSRGFRGPEWDLARGDGRPRVLVLGDSFAFGWGVEYAESLCGRLATLEPSWKVYDAAVSGFGSDQESLVLDQLVDEIAPDVVLVVFCENDLYENSLSVTYGKHKPWFERSGGGLELHGVPVPRPWLERISALWRAVEKTRWEDSFAARPRDVEAEWQLTEDIYRRMRARLGATPLLVASSDARLARFARESGVCGHVDLLPALSMGATSGASGPVAYPKDGHWTPEGHRRVAEVVHGSLVRALKQR